MLTPIPLRRLALAIALATSCTAQAAPLVLDIPAQPLASALRQLGEASGLTIAVDSALVQGRNAPAVHGKLEASDALARLLAGSGLSYQQAGNTLVIGAVDQEALELEATNVTGTTIASQDISTEGSGSYAAKGASILKGAKTLKEIPQTVSVITRKQMDDRRLDTLDEVLAKTPGITLRRRVGGGNDIISRGFETNTLQYDGVPLSRSYINGNSLSSSSVYLDRVEVLRGAQGLLEGAGSPAGSVNLVRKRGLAEHAFSMEGRTGSWDNYGSRLDIGAPLNDEKTIRSRTVLDYEDKGSFIDNVWDRNVNTYAAIDIDMTPDTTIGLGIAYSRLKGNSMVFSGISRYANGASLPLSRKANLDADWSKSTREESQVFFDLEHRLNQNWTLKAAGSYIDESFDAITALSYFSLIPLSGSTMTAPGFDEDFRGTSKGMDINLNGDLQLFGMAHEMVIGGNYANQVRDDSFNEYSPTTIDISEYGRDITKLSTRTLTRKRDMTSESTQRGLYALWRAHLTERATLILGSRVSWYESKNQNYNPIANTVVSRSHRQESGEVTPYAGIVYSVTPQWSIYTSYAEIFEPQSAIDASLKVLPPMTGSTYEAGLKGELFDGGLMTSLAVYRTEQKDRAVTDYDSGLVCNNSYCSRAAGKVRSEGIDLEAHGNLTNNLQISAGYTYNRNKYLEDEDTSLIGKPFSHENPKHLIRLWSDYQLRGDLSKWRVGLGIDYRSRQKTGSTTMLDPVQGGYSVWSGRIAYEPDTHWSASLNIDNIFDKKYYSSIAESYVNNYIGEPRNTLLSIRYKF